MFKVAVNEELYTHCENQLEKHNFGARFTANGSKEQQLTGIIGQSVVMDLFDLGYVKGESGFDDGVDILFDDKKIDVKTMGRTTDVKQNYTNNFLKLQDYFNTDIYIFCSYNKLKKELTICGWVSKEEFKLKRKFFPEGTLRYRNDGTSFTTFADLFEIDICNLNDVNSIEDLKNQIRLYKLT